MKRLSDYKNDEAIDLWADLLDPMTEIFGDKNLAAVWKSDKPMTIKAKEVLKTHKKAVTDILLRIDNTPVDGLNIVVRLIALLNDFQAGGSGFFGSAGQETTERGSSGSATENTEADAR